MFSQKTPHKSLPAPQVTAPFVPPINPELTLKCKPPPDIFERNTLVFPQWKREVRACGLDYSKSKPFHGVSGKPGVKEIIPALSLKRSSAICWPLSSLVSLSAVRFVDQSGLCHETLQSNDDQNTLKAQGQAEGR